MRGSLSDPSRNREWLYQIGAVLFWLGIWQAASTVVGQAIILPSPIQAARRLWQLLQGTAFYAAVFSSLGRILIGFALAVSLGTLFAALSALSTAIRRLLTPPMAAISATPIASFAILALVMIGKRNLSIFISLLMSLPVVYLNVLKGIDSADRSLLEMADVFRIRPAKRVRAIYAPSALPYLISACQIALGMCWKSGLAAEVIGQPDGSIGDALYRAKIFLETDSVFAWTIAIIALSVLMERAMMALIGRFGRD